MRFARRRSEIRAVPGDSGPPTRATMRDGDTTSEMVASEPNRTICYYGCCLLTPGNTVKLLLYVAFYVFFVKICTTEISCRHFLLVGHRKSRLYCKFSFICSHSTG